MPEETPTLAVALALVAAVFQAIGAFTVALVFAPLAAFVGSLGLLGTGLALLFVLLALLGAYWLSTGQKRLVTYGGILTLLVALLALPTGWGLIIGSLLGFIAGILGLVWRPTTLSSPRPTPPPVGP